MHTMNMTTSWINHALWWHVYPLGFVGAPVRPTQGQRRLTHRLRYLSNWLNYMIELGVNGLALGPIFTSQSHGYDTTDYFHIDPRLGDDEDFDDLVRACHARGISVMLDGVFNHVGEKHPLFTAAQKGLPEEEYFQITHSGSGGKPQFAKFEGHGSLPELNHESAKTTDLVYKVMDYWCGRGVDAWRLDAAYAIDTHFLAAVSQRIKNKYPHVWLMGEVIHGDYPTFIAQSHIDSLTQYELWKAVWSSLKAENFFELDYALGRHNTFLKAFTPFTFVGNHDVSRIATVVGESKATLAHVILLTVGGIPAIYYGDEQIMTGVKVEAEGGDDAIRPAFPPTPNELPQHGIWMYRIQQDLISIRRRNPWLAHAQTTPVRLTNETYTYESVGREGQRLRVELTLTPTPSARLIFSDGTSHTFTH